MIYYMIRHVETKEFMPQLRLGKGYSHWNPAKADTKEIFGDKLLGVPRLFGTIRNAHWAITAWNAVPNARAGGHRSYDGEWDDTLTITNDDRKRTDLEIVLVNIEETGVVSIQEIKRRK